VIRQFNSAILSAKTHELENVRKICVVGNRYYQWIRLLDNPRQFEYIERLLSDSMAGICRDLMRLKLDYDICETVDPERLSQYEAVIIPTAEFMPEAMQTAVVELAKKGVNIIACGLMPRYDENFRDCLILSRHMRIKTTLNVGVDQIKLKHSQFTSAIYGNILSTDPKVKKLATASKRNVGVASSRYKGTFYLFSFNIGSDGDHNKMSFIESLLTENDISSAIYCSDPSVDIAVHRADKKAILYVVAPPSGELSALANTASRDVIIRADLRKLGIASAKIKMIDLMSGENPQQQKLSSETLRKGMPLRLDFPDGRIFLLEPK
jgi:hypothetical protein